MDLSPISADDAQPLDPLPNCFTPLNDAHYQAIIAQIDAAISEVSLQFLTNYITKEINLLIQTIQSQINKLLPYEALLTAPTDLASCIQWITSAIQVFEQTYAAYAKLVAQVALLETQLSQIVTEIERVANLHNWSINIPVGFNCQLP